MEGKNGTRSLPETKLLSRLSVSIECLPSETTPKCPPNHLLSNVSSLDLSLLQFIWRGFQLAIAIFKSLFLLAWKKSTSATQRVATWLYVFLW
mmetsp:Transcript_22103/g.40145  ORF Transcript_22103/g.40145 Transcript_22103/m.40145 type:complete len:93 (+) Transcript_22103:247-525(+)